MNSPFSHCFSVDGGGGSASRSLTLGSDGYGVSTSDGPQRAPGRVRYTEPDSNRFKLGAILGDGVRVKAEDGSMYPNCMEWLGRAELNEPLARVRCAASAHRCQGICATATLLSVGGGGWPRAVACLGGSRCLQWTR